MESVVLHRVGFLEYFCPKQGRDFKPSAAPCIYPNMGKVPSPPGVFVCLRAEPGSWSSIVFKFIIITVLKFIIADYYKLVSLTYYKRITLTLK